MTQQALTRLRNLKLTGMADAVQQQLEQASTYEGLPFIRSTSPEYATGGWLAARRN